MVCLGLVIDVPKKSKGHIFFQHGYEYLYGDKYVFKADLRNPVECTGNRECAHFVMTIEDWNKTTRGKQFPVVVKK
jgi:hypothetical protein